MQKAPHVFTERRWLILGAVLSGSLVGTLGNSLTPVALPAMMDHFDVGIDIGEATQAMFTGVVTRGRTVVWNGPMGVVEIPAAATGTLSIARALAVVTARGAMTVVAGGDSVAALEKSGLADKVTHVSTGGGAALEFLGGKELPGIAHLSEAVNAH